MKCRNAIFFIVILVFIFPTNLFADNAAFVFVKTMGGTGADITYNQRSDSQGNIYNTGIFAGTADFDPGEGTVNLSSAGGEDIFISKLDSDGNLIWVKGIGGTGSDYGRSVFLDSEGNIYLAGFFANTVDFDPGAGTVNLTSNGLADAYVLKLNSDGDFVWAKSVGGTGTDYSYNTVTDFEGSVYITGVFQNTVDFDPGEGTVNLTSAGGNDVFIYKLNSNGDFVWAKSMGGAGADVGRFVTLDSEDNVYTTGGFSSTADFDPGAGTENLISVGGTDIFISKLDSSGEYIWAKNIGGTSGDYGYTLLVDPQDNLYTTGFFASTADFDPGVGTINLTSAGGNDAFISKLNSDGEFLFAKGIGGTGTDYGYFINMNSVGDIFLSGFFQNTVDFDPGSGTSNVTSAGDSDIFILKLKALATPTVSLLKESTVTNTGVTLNATVLTTGNDTNTEQGFEYGPTTSYGSTASNTGSFGTGPFSITLSGLTCATTYQYRAFTTNMDSTAYSQNRSFTTLPCTRSSGGTSSSGRVANLISLGNTQLAEQIVSTLPTFTPITPLTTTLQSIPPITRTLAPTYAGTDVKALQQLLNSLGFTITSTGEGSPGNETTYFGPLTKDALIRFQEAHAIHILTPLGLTKGTGIFGPMTQKFIQSLIK